MLTSLFKLDANFRHAMAVLNGACIRTKIRGQSLLDDESASDSMLNRWVDDAVVSVGWKKVFYIKYIGWIRLWQKNGDLHNIEVRKA